MAKSKGSSLNQIQTWSSKMDQLFDDEIEESIVNDPRTTENGNRNPLGYPHGIIQPQVLKRGRADFRLGYKHARYGRLSKSDRVLLYCYMNLRGHFHSSKAHFALCHWLRKDYVDCDPVLIDVGCGPATSALAFADLYPKSRFTYIGIDAASAMRKRGKKLLEAAMTQRIIDKQSTVSFKSNWDSLAASFPPRSTVMFNFAFFFASESLRTRHLRSLADRIDEIGTRLPSRRLIISYTNSVHQVANDRYEEFLDILSVKPKAGRHNCVVRYRNRIYHNKGFLEQNFSRELFELNY